MRSPSSNATVGDVGVTTKSTCSKAASKSCDDPRPHLLRRAVVRLVVAGREGVGADHDAALDLLAEALRPRQLVHAQQVVEVLAAVAVADAVVAAEVRARLGRARSRSRRRCRGRRSAASMSRTLPPSSSMRSSVRRQTSATPGSRPSSSRPQDAEAKAVEALRARHRHLLRQTERRRVARIAPGERAQHQGGVRHVARERPALVERRREGDHPVAADRAVGRLEPDDAA